MHEFDPLDEFVATDMMLDTHAHGNWPRMCY